MRSLWLGTAVALLTVFGIVPGGAATVGLPAASQLTAASGDAVVQVKKKNKRAKRHGHRKKLRRHQAHRHGKRPRIIVRPHRDEYVIVHRAPNIIVQVRPSAELMPQEDRRALQPPDLPAESYSSQAAGAPITCDDGIAIARDFGFSDVEPRACSGQTYDFAAVRDGQPYAIRMRSADGELIEVRRQ